MLIVLAAATATATTTAAEAAPADLPSTMSLEQAEALFSDSGKRLNVANQELAPFAPNPLQAAVLALPGRTVRIIDDATVSAGQLFGRRQSATRAASAVTSPFWGVSGFLATSEGLVRTASGSTTLAPAPGSSSDDDSAGEQLAAELRASGGGSRPETFFVLAPPPPWWAFRRR
ncbi:MAG: hypothetical protein Q9227_006377 [Pyrenula ochraceoflavens]